MSQISSLFIYYNRLEPHRQPAVAIVETRRINHSGISEIDDETAIHPFDRK